MKHDEIWFYKNNTLMKQQKAGPIKSQSGTNLHLHTPSHPYKIDFLHVAAKKTWNKTNVVMQSLPTSSWLAVMCLQKASQLLSL